VKHHSALISRPYMHTFHDVASGGTDFTIGSSQWSDNTKKLRAVVAQDSTRTAVQGHVPTIAAESDIVIARLKRDSDSGARDLDVGDYMRHYAINMVLMLYLGVHLDHDSAEDMAIMDKLVYSEREIAKIRTTCNNWQDYNSFFRLFPGRDRHANKMRILQDEFTDDLFARLEKEMANGTDRPCVVGDIAKGEKADSFTRGDLKSLCLSTIAASVLTEPGNLIMPVAWLSSEAGQTTQQRIYEDIMAAYPDGDAWDRVVTEEKVPRLSAFIKEALRYFTVLPMLLPRQSVKDVVYNGKLIPAGTEFHMNAWAANYDETRFERPFAFDPDRFARSATAGQEGSDLEHFSFGAGSRICPGMHLGNRMVYAMLARLILTYRILPAKKEEDLPDLNALECRLNRNNIALDPKPFKCGFMPRGEEKLHRVDSGVGF